MTVRKLIGLIQFGALDLTMGAFIAHSLHLTTNTQTPPWMYVLGATLGVLPDFDLLLSAFRANKLDLKHRNTIFHQPLLLAAIPGMMVAFISPFWALLWVLPLVWHYVHDTVGESMGVAWLYPFSRKKFALFDYDEEGSRRLLVTHPEDYAGMTLDEAMRKKFYRVTPTSLIEAGIPLTLLIIIMLWSS